MGVAHVVGGVDLLNVGDQMRIGLKGMYGFDRAFGGDKRGHIANAAPQFEHDIILFHNAQGGVGLFCLIGVAAQQAAHFAADDVGVFGKPHATRCDETISDRGGLCGGDVGGHVSSPCPRKGRRRRVQSRPV